MKKELISQYTAVGAIKLHHLEWVGDSPPIIYIPGFIANAYGAIKLANATSQRVCALDLRGRGQSDKPETGYGIQQHVQDLDAWLTANQIDSCILAGHSFGASVSLFFYLAHPKKVKKIILFDGGTPPSETAFDLFKAYHNNLTYHYPSVEKYISQYRKIPALQPWTDAAEQLTRANVIEQPDGSARRAVPEYVVKAELDALNQQIWQAITQRYNEIQVPVLLIRAGMGAFSKEDQHITDDMLPIMQDNFPNLQIFDMPHAGHTSVLTIDDSNRDNIIQNFVTS